MDVDDTTTVVVHLKFPSKMIGFVMFWKCVPEIVIVCPCAIVVGWTLEMDGGWEKWIVNVLDEYRAV